jgi:AraC-like DNA-binding protein
MRFTRVPIMSEQTEKTRYQVKNVKYGEKLVRGRVIGRKKTVIPEEEFYKLACLHLSWRELANHFDVHENTLRDNFRDLYTKGINSTKQRLRQKALDMAFNGDRVMLIFSLKNLVGWSDAPNTNEDSEVLPWNAPLETDSEE